MQVQVGLERLASEGLPVLRGRRVGLVTNHTGVDGRLRSGIDLLAGRSDFALVALFGPEHGVRGDVQAGEHVASAVDTQTGLSVHSLYGATKKPTTEMLQGIDALLFDIQDSVCRYYTYQYTMARAMEAAGEAGIPFVVLDRPNPITGVIVEGNVLDPRFHSFVGMYPTATRPALTSGEMARLFREEFGVDAELHVLPMEGWRREMWYDETGLPFVPPSPNSPSLEMLTVYPGTCLLEGTNLSEGRGTTRPFELVGAPWIDPHQAAKRLNDLELSGVLFRPAVFVPTFSKHKGESCGGVQLHVIDRNAFRAVVTGLAVIEVMRAMEPSRFRWLDPWTAGGHRPFDLLAGTDSVRIEIEKGSSAQEIAATWRAEQAGFEQLRRKYLLYQPTS